MAYITRDDEISALSLSVRATNALRRAGIHTVGALLNFAAADKSLSVIDEIIERFNLRYAHADEEIGSIITDLSNDKVLQSNVQNSTTSAYEAAVTERLSSRIMDGVFDGAVSGDTEKAEFYTELSENTSALIQIRNSIIRKIKDNPKDRLREIRNLGDKSVTEILSVLSELQVLADSGEEEPIAPSQTEKNDTLEQIVLGRVFTEADGAAYYDVPLEQLGLSARAYHGLRRKGMHFASELLGITDEELYGIHNLGKKTVDEILEVSRNMHFERVRLDGQVVAHEVEEEEKGKIAPVSMLISELTNTFGGNRGYWMKLITETRDEHPEVGMDMLPYLLYRQTDLAETAKGWVLRQVENHGDSLGRERYFELLPSHLRNTTVPEEWLLALEQEKKITLEKGMIRRRYPSVWEAVKQLQDERARVILQMRLNGATLQEVGDALGITRERARQIEIKNTKKLPRVAEDRYGELFAAYDFDRESFCLAFDEPSGTYHYLEKVVTRKEKRKSLAELLTDETVSVEVRRQAERAVYKDYVTLDGVRVRKKRPELVERFAKQFCRDSIPYSEFVEAYNQWLSDLGISDDRLLLNDERAYENEEGIELMESRTQDKEQGRKRLYNRLLKLCNAKGVTPSRMATDCGMSRSTMGRLRTGERKSITISSAKNLADYFGVSVDYVLGNTDTPNPVSNGTAYQASTKVIISDAENEHLGLWRLLSQKDRDRLTDDMVGCAYSQLHELADYFDYLNFKDERSPEDRDPDALETVRRAARSAGMRMDFLEMFLDLPEGRLSDPDAPGVSTAFAKKAVNFIEMMHTYVKSRHINYSAVAAQWRSTTQG